MMLPSAHPTGPKTPAHPEANSTVSRTFSSVKLHQPRGELEGCKATFADASGHKPLQDFHRYIGAMSQPKIKHLEPRSNPKKKT
jgi:hypothetical protein